MTRITPFILAAAMFVLSPPAAQPSEPPQEKPGSLEDFEILQYVAAGRYAPEVSIGLDNNAQILLACREGSSEDKLRQAGLEFAASQIEFLIAVNLLFRDGRGDLWTAFPILDEAAVTGLREETSDLAEELSAVVLTDVQALARQLDVSGLGTHGYSLVFSYVLDGMVWGFLEEYQRVAPRRLSARRPFWSGEVWALRPDREFRASTRSIAHRGVKLVVSSSAGSRDGAMKLFGDSRAVKNALEQYADTGGLEAGPLRQQMAEFGLVDADGVWAIPVIDEVEKGPVFRAAETLTSNLVDAILEKIDLEGLQARYGFRSASQALVVAYHELMWDLMGRFEDAGLIEKPVSLSGASSAEQSALSDAAFVVDRQPQYPDRQDVVEPRRDVLDEPSRRGDGP